MKPAKLSGAEQGSGRWMMVDGRWRMADGRRGDTRQVEEWWGSDNMAKSE